MNESDEAQYVAARILEDYSQGIPWKDHAVLYRMNAQSNQMEQAFKRNGVPYRIIGGTRFFDRAEVKDMIAYLAVLNNPEDDLRLTRIINNPPRGIGLKTVETAQEVARRENTSLYAVIDHARQYPELERSAGKLAVFTSLMGELRELLGKLPLDQFYEELIVRTETKNTVEDRTRLENVRELLTSIRGYLENAGDEPSLAGFLDEIALYTDLDSHDPDQDCVVMMTMHSAKGLEFPVVFVVGAEEGIFPGIRAIGEQDEMEEPRRSSTSPAPTSACSSAAPAPTGPPAFWRRSPRSTWSGPAGISWTRPPTGEESPAAPPATGAMGSGGPTPGEGGTPSISGPGTRAARPAGTTAALPGPCPAAERPGPRPPASPRRPARLPRTSARGTWSSTRPSAGG